MACRGRCAGTTLALLLPFPVLFTFPISFFIFKWLAEGGVQEMTLAPLLPFLFTISHSFFIYLLCLNVHDWHCFHTSIHFSFSFLVTLSLTNFLWQYFPSFPPSLLPLARHLQWWSAWEMGGCLGLAKTCNNPSYLCAVLDLLLLPVTTLASWLLLLLLLPLVHVLGHLAY